MRFLGILFLLGALTLLPRAQETNPATGSRQVGSAARAASGIWLDVPFFPQQRNGCGASSLAMILQYWNSLRVVDPQSIFRELYSEELKGIPASRMKSYLEEHGFRVFTFSGTLPDLKGHLLKGRPLIVSLGGSSLHYVVVVGLDERQNLVLVNDPAVKKLSRMDQGEFLTAWKSTHCWTLLAVPNVRP
jgi:ABC-type bacteriocin/lantibiotic exporter with double-glycine peptidase domain